MLPSSLSMANEISILVLSDIYLKSSMSYLYRSVCSSVSTGLGGFGDNSALLCRGVGFVIASVSFVLD